MFLPSLRADYRAIETYRPADGAMVGCPVVALTGDADPKTTPDEARAWQEHTTGPFDLQVFGGGHFYLSDETEAVARLLQGAELLRHGSTEVTDLFLATRAPGSPGAWGAHYGTLSGAVTPDAARAIVQRAMVFG